MGHTVGLKFKVQVGLGILVPYISPPLICARFSRVNQRIEGAKGLADNSNRQNRVAEASINALSKGVPLLVVRSFVIIV